MIETTNCYCGVRLMFIFRMMGKGLARKVLAGTPKWTQDCKPKARQPMTLHEIFESQDNCRKFWKKVGAKKGCYGWFLFHGAITVANRDFDAAKNPLSQSDVRMEVLVDLFGGKYPGYVVWKRVTDGKTCLYSCIETFHHGSPLSINDDLREALVSALWQEVER